jgi:BolA family transcriptional regulator, general stress-responsive regulator
MSITDIITARLQQAFTPTHLEVLDESDQHLGHGGYRAGGSHFAIIISADEFNHLSKVAAHRKIYAALQDMIPKPIHALRIVIL